MSPTCSETRLASDARARTETFDDVVLPHLAEASRLARWLTRNDHEAEDVVQEAALRALRYFRTFSGRNGRGWFLTIVRNTCHAWHRDQRQATIGDEFDEELHRVEPSTPDPEGLVLRADAAIRLEQALQNLPERFRELVVLREIEGLSYRELADVLKVPIGTVMSGLFRARHALRRALIVAAGRHETRRARRHQRFRPKE